MIEKLLQKYPAKSFRYFCSIFCFLGDFLIAIFLYLVFSDYSSFEKLLRQTLSIQGLTLEQVDPSFLAAQFKLATHSLFLILVLLLATHFIVYAFFIKGSLKAARYMKGMIWVTLATSFFFIFEAWSVHKLFSILFTLQTPIYYYCYRGLKGEYFLDKKPNHLARS